MQISWTSLVGLFVCVHLVSPTAPQQIECIYTYRVLTGKTGPRWQDSVTVDPPIFQLHRDFTINWLNLKTAIGQNSYRTVKKDGNEQYWQQSSGLYRAAWGKIFANQQMPESKVNTVR